MAKILKTNKEVEEINPKNGRDFTLEELQGVVGGYIETISLCNGWILVVNEEGRLNGLPYNALATSAVRIAFPKSDCEIVGNALLCKDCEVK